VDEPFISGAVPCLASEGFSPDAPGACAKRTSRAAQLELEAAQVAAGL
jgi:hypothetical protein